MRVCGVVGWKNSGKTTLVERLVTHFTARGLIVSTIKHAHHALEVDTPGRDSFRHRAAGAREVLVSGGARWALIHENRGEAEPTLDDLLAKLAPAGLVLVEGFKTARHLKVEAFRATTAQAPLASSDDTIIAVASDAPLEGLSCPTLPLDDVEGVANAIAHAVGLAPMRV